LISRKFSSVLEEALQAAHKPAHGKGLGETGANLLIVGREWTDRPGGQVDSRSEPPPGSIDPLELTLATPTAFSPAIGEGGCSATPGRKPVALPAVDVALIEQVVRRVVWGGDRRRGVVRIELDGEFAGTSIALSGAGGELELELAAGPGLEARGLAERLLARLRARGFVVARFELR
jgi:hypothetical protein